MPNSPSPEYLSIVLAPYYVDGAPGHYQTFPDAFRQALSAKGIALVAHPNSESIRLSGAFHDVSHPILQPSFFLALQRLVRASRPRKVLLQSIDCKLSALPFLHLAKFALGKNLKISAVLFENAQIVESKLRSKLRLKALKFCEPIACASEAQLAVLQKFGIAARRVSDFSCFEHQIHSHGSQSCHGRVRLIFRGTDLLGKFRLSEPVLCKECTYEVHLPEEEKDTEIPVNFHKTDRLTTGQQYFNQVLGLRHQVFLYDQSFDLPSARVDDSLMAGIPCAVPLGGELERQVQSHGNGLTFDPTFPDFESLLNHPKFSPQKKRILTVQEYVNEELANEATSSRLPNFWLTMYCVTEMVRFLSSGAKRVAQRNAPGWLLRRPFGKPERN